MKLRIRGDSLRLRLGLSEAAAIAAGEAVVESISFGREPAQVLTYSLEASVETDRLWASFESNRIRIRIPQRLARSWHESEQIAIEQTQPIDAGRFLTLLIEKDFACLNARPGDQAEAYPNPHSVGDCAPAVPDAASSLNGMS
jgi:hypothetical protein